MADFNQREFDESLDKFYNKLKSLSDSLGRGGQGSNANKTGPVPRNSAATAEAKAQKENRVEVDKSTKSIKAQRVQTDAEIKASKEAVKAQKDLTKEQLDALEAQEDINKAFKGFGKTLIGENANLSSAFSNLSYNLQSTGTVFGRVAGGVAAGVGYMLGNLQEFAKNAGDMGAFADLSKFSVGSVTQMKLLSGLGSAFIKVIEESQGTFKAFGSNSQEAAENLSNLSRGLKYGSFYLNSTLRKSLGTDLVKSVDKASNAAASMGLSDEERAKLMGSLAQTASMGAKTEQDAQQRLVKQYSDTLDSTRKLSNAFGLGAKEILASMERFRQSTAGKFASAKGNTGAAVFATTAEQMGITSDADVAARIAKAISEGDLGAAKGALGQSGGNASQQRILDELFAASQGTNGGKDTAAFAANMKRLEPRLEALAAEGDQLAVNNAELAAPLGKLFDFVNKSKQGGKDDNKEAPRTSETDNIKSMNNLTAALESLRSTILGLSIGIATLVGSLGALVVAGGIGGLMSGGLGKIGGMLGGGLSKVGDWAKNTKAGGWIAGKMGGAGSAGSGVMDSLSGAAGKGMEGFGDMLGKLGESKTVKGAGTLALLGSALALTAVGLKTFNEVNWTSLVKGTLALGGLIGMARLVGEATTGIIKGAAAIAILGGAVALSAIGFKTFNDVNWDSLIKGAGAIAILGVGAQLLGKMTGSILMGALAITALGAAMWVAGKGFQTFNDLNWEGIAKGAVALGVFAVAAGVMGGFLPVIAAGALAIGLLGVALGVFGAGAWVAAQAADVFANAIEKVGNIDGVNLIAVGAGLAAIGAGAVIFAAGMVAATATSLVTGLMSLFGAKSPIDRILALVPVADKISLVGQGMMNFGSGIGLINENLKALDLDALEKFKNVLVEMSDIDIPSLDGLSIPQISTEGIAVAPQQNNTLSNALAGNSAVTPEVIGQLMSYLSSIENDLAAIRGNTRQTGYESPVRLS